MYLREVLEDRSHTKIEKKKELVCVVEALGKSRWFHSFHCCCFIYFFLFNFAFAAEENVLGVSKGFWKSFLNSEREVQQEERRKFLLKSAFIMIIL